MVQETCDKIEADICKLGTPLGEVAFASEEQAHGIVEINRTVTEVVM